MADAPDLGSGGEILRGSSPLPGTSIGEANALYVEIRGTGPAVASGECAYHEMLPWELSVSGPFKPRP